MLTEKDSEIGTIAAIGPFGAPPHSKYERLIARAKEVPAATTIVVHPCDETSLRGAIEAAEAGIIVPILVGPAAKISAVAREHGLEIGGFRDRRRAAQRGGGGKGGRADPRVQGRAPDEGQPAHRRADARGDLAARPACARRGASATSSSWTCRPMPRRCSSPTPRSTSFPTSTPSATSSRTPSICSRRSASARRGSRFSPRSRR